MSLYIWLLTATNYKPQNLTRIKLQGSTLVETIHNTFHKIPQNTRQVIAVTRKWEVTGARCRLALWEQFGLESCIIMYYVFIAAQIAQVAQPFE